MKESSPSCICVQSSCVPTEVDYSTKVDQKPTQDELNNMVHAEKGRLWDNREKQTLKVENEKKGKTTYSYKKSYITFKERREIILTLRRNFINMVI